MSYLVLILVDVAIIAFWLGFVSRGAVWSIARAWRRYQERRLWRAVSRMGLMTPNQIRAARGMAAPAPWDER